MARPRKPTALKILHGDFKKNPQRRNQQEPQLEVQSPDCPAWITGDARAEWKRVTAELLSMRVLTLQERAELEAYCTIYSRWRVALKHVAKHGLILTTGFGDSENPASKIAARCEDQMHRYLSQFGMNPVSRSRVNITQQTEPLRMRRQR